MRVTAGVVWPSGAKDRRLSRLLATLVSFTNPLPRAMPRIAAPIARNAASADRTNVARPRLALHPLRAFSRQSRAASSEWPGPSETP